MNDKKVVLGLVVSLSLIACGGGSSGGAKPTEPVVEPPKPAPVIDHSGLAPLTADEIDELEYLAGGDATLFVADEDAFSTRPQAIADNFQHDGFFTSGDHLFRTPHSDIGPLLNTGTCQGCHENDGRGVVPKTPSDAMLSMLVKLGDDTGAADPVYGDQIQPFAEQSFTSSDFASGLPVHNGSLNGTELYGEAFPFVEFQIIEGQYPDGTDYQLRKPIYKVRDLSFGPFKSDIHFSPRVAPQAFGVGLLAEIPSENILKLVDENDADGDGISGRASMVTEAVSGEQKLGRFAYKAQNPTVLQQTAGAYNGDIGISTSVFSGESCTEQQIACQMVAEQETKVGSDVDFSDRELALVEFYTRVLGVPARRGYDADNDIWQDDIKAGRQLFFNSNCIGCHTPRHVTGVAPGSVLGELTLTGLEENAEPIALLSEQTIFPYTDLLLHDMGGSCQVTRETIDQQSCNDDGEQCLYVQRCDGLADGLIQGDASGSEWKTPALWGLGLVQTVNAESTFLHDGRARTIEEAILWHGGEAQASKESFMALSQTERQQLLDFLGSL